MISHARIKKFKDREKKKRNNTKVKVYLGLDFFYYLWYNYIRKGNKITIK